MGISSIFAGAESHFMDIQEKKLKLIEEFLRISDEHVLDKLEAIIRKEVHRKYSEDVKPMSLSELHEMIDDAKLDYQNGRVTTHEDLKKEVLTWK
jgi:chemotaxis protein CheY-P-specific phosphatase CheC